jgi:cell division protein FtsL
MSSTPKKEQPEKKGPRPEKKSGGAGFEITPQVLMVVLAIILVIGIVVYWQMVISKFNSEIDQTDQSIAAEERKITTYRTKGAKLEAAQELNQTLREKLNTINYLFLHNQDSIVPFFENTFLPIIANSRLDPTADSKIEVEEYTFQINMAMEPFNTLPSTRFFENAEDIFPIKYIGEKNGNPETDPISTEPSSFLEPYEITLTDWGGTYEDVKDFVEHVQTAEDDILITIHCMINDDGNNVGWYRTWTTWTIAMTVYFMNPAGTATGDNPPGAPGSRSC